MVKSAVDQASSESAPDGGSPEISMDDLLYIVRSGLSRTCEDESWTDGRSASDCFDVALGYLEKEKRAVGTLTMLKARLEMGKALSVFGEWDRAVSYFEEVSSGAGEAGDLKMKAEALGEMGRIDRRRGQWAQALDNYKKVKGILEELGDRTGIACTTNCIGAVYFEQGDLESAEKSFREALEFASESGDSQLIGQVVNNLAAIASAKGEFVKAISLYQKALPRFDDVGDARGMGEVYHNIGLCYVNLGELYVAGQFYEKSLALSFEAGDKELVTTTHLSKAGLCMSLNDWGAARLYCQKALDGFSSLGERLGMAEAYRLLGLVAEHQGHQQLSKSYFENALRIDRDCGSLLELAEVCRDYGATLLKRGAYEKSGELLKESMRIFQNLEATKNARMVKTYLDELNGLLSLSAEGKNGRREN
jgi:tetratricopeptide (TPR) repeat protein